MTKVWKQVKYSRRFDKAVDYTASIKLDKDEIRKIYEEVVAEALLASEESDIVDFDVYVTASVRGNDWSDKFDGESA